MIVVIQESTARQPQAGHMKTRDGKRVAFVAHPRQAPAAEGVLYAHPDAWSNFGAPWRKLLLSYNANPRDNPLGLLPAWQLFADGIYRQLVERWAPGRTCILTAGWGLIRASFLTPDYAITLSPEAEPFQRRAADDPYTDFRMLPDSKDDDEELFFFGEAAWVPLFCRLTAGWRGRRIVFHRGARAPEAPGCELRRFDTPDAANWHHACAAEFLANRPEPRSECANGAASPKVSNIVSRLAAMKASSDAVPPLPGGLPGPDAETARAAVRGARERLAEYRWLRQALPAVDVRDDAEFQARFNAFHNISERSPDWYAAYYRLLETAKIIGAEFADVLDELWEETGRYDPAYASRLVAAVDPEQPVWDRFALMHTGLRAPAYLDPDKLRNAANVYRSIREWYAACLESPGGRRIVDLFDEAAPGCADISALKKLECVLRHTRAEHRAVTAAR